MTVFTTTNKDPSISNRQGIAIGFSAPYEDTSTLVLTSPAGRFVDIRFPLAVSSTSTGSGSDANPNPDDDQRAYTRHPAFWAFAGRSSAMRPQAGAFPAWDCASHCVWTHEIDSRGEGARDEGDMFDLMNGDSMEVGVMVDRGTGREVWYKEYWTSPRGDGVLPCLVAEAVAGGPEGEGEGKLKGRIVMVGRHCQGIVEAVDGGVRGATVLVERWAYDAGGAKPGWVRQEPDRGEVALDVSGDALASPYSWILSDDRRLGEEVDFSDHSTGPQRWRVVECLR